MKLKVSKDALFTGLQTVQNVVGLRSPLPILANVLMTAEKDHLLMTTTNLDVSVKYGVEASVSSTGATTLPVKRLVAIVRELQEEVEIEVDDKNVAVVTSGSSYFRIMGLSEEDFPPVPKPENEYAYHMDQGAFRDMLRRTAYAASTDESRYVLNGVLMSFRAGKLAMVATDGRRMALVEQEMEIPREAEVEMILPSKAVNELQHTLKETGDLKVYAKGGQVIFQFGETTIASKLIEGTYPNYRQVMPSQCQERITIERESLLSALRRVSLLMTEKTNAVKLNFAKNRLTITLNSPDVGEARDSLPIKYTGKEISVSFNPEFMMDPLKNLDADEVFLELTDELSPGVIKADIPFLYVLMPMRVGQ
jgi:DNA polymerase-3 subunit beta